MHRKYTTTIAFSILYLVLHQGCLFRNDVPPEAAITFPPDQSIIYGPIDIKAYAHDDKWIKRVSFYVDGELIGRDNSEPYEQYWDVLYWADGAEHVLKVKAVDDDGNVGQSDPLHVTVSGLVMNSPQLAAPQDSSRFSSTQAQLIWYFSSAATQYQVEVYADADTSQVEFSATTADTSISTPDLGEGWHRWHVRWRNDADQWSGWSAIRTFYIGNYAMFTRTYGGIGWDEAASIMQMDDGGYVFCGITPHSVTTRGTGWLVKIDTAGHLDWSQSFEGESQDWFTDVVATNDGGLAITGTLQSGTALGADIWLVKTDAFGNEEWSHHYGENNGDHGYAIIQTSDGGFLIGGSSITYGPGSYDMWLIKTDVMGNMQWYQTYGTSDRYEEIYSLSQSTGGGFILTGKSFDPGETTLWLIRTNTSGDETWRYVHDASVVTEGYSVQQTEDGGYICTGIMKGHRPENGAPDVLLVKIDANGNEQWIKTFGGMNGDVGHAVRQTTDGGYIVAAFTESKGAGQGDIWLIKTDEYGSLQWEKLFGGGEEDQPRDIELTDDGGYVIAGCTRSYGAGNKDAWVIKTDPYGNTLP